MRHPRKNWVRKELCLDIFWERSWVTSKMAQEAKSLKNQLFFLILRLKMTDSLEAYPKECVRKDAVRSCFL